MGLFMVNKKVSLSSAEIDRFIATIIEIEKNFASASKRDIPEERKLYLLRNRQAFRRKIVTKYDDISLYSIYNGLGVYHDILGEDMSFFTDFMRRSLYNRIVEKDGDIGITSTNVERFYLRAVNLVFEFGYVEKISPYDTLEQAQAKLGVVRRFNKEVVDTCNMDEIRALIQKLGEYKKNYKEDSVVVGCIEDDLVERISGQVIENYFNGKNRSNTRIKR